MCETAELPECHVEADYSSVVDGGRRVCHHPSRHLCASMMKLRFASMTVGLALGITAAVVVACAAAAYVFSVHHFQSVLDTVHSSALAEGELIRTALEHQMMGNDRTLIAQMIESFGKQARVEQLVVLDRNGVQRYSSKPVSAGNDFRIDSPTCQAFHRDPEIIPR